MTLTLALILSGPAVRAKPRKGEHLMKMTPEYLMVRAEAIAMDKALTRISDGLGLLAAHDIVSEHDAMILVNKFACDIVEYIVDRLPLEQANAVVEELCKED